MPSRYPRSGQLELDFPSRSDDSQPTIFFAVTPHIRCLFLEGSPQRKFPCIAQGIAVHVNGFYFCRVSAVIFSHELTVNLLADFDAQVLASMQNLNVHSGENLPANCLAALTSMATWRHIVQGLATSQDLALHRGVEICLSELHPLARRLVEKRINLDPVIVFDTFSTARTRSQMITVQHLLQDFPLCVLQQIAHEHKFLPVKPEPNVGTAMRAAGRIPRRLFAVCDDLGAKDIALESKDLERIVSLTAHLSERPRTDQQFFNFNFLAKKIASFEQETQNKVVTALQPSCRGSQADARIAWDCLLYGAEQIAIKLKVTRGDTERPMDTCLTAIADALASVTHDHPSLMKELSSHWTILTVTAQLLNVAIDQLMLPIFSAQDAPLPLIHDEDFYTYRRLESVLQITSAATALGIDDLNPRCVVEGTLCGNLYFEFCCKDAAPFIAVFSVSQFGIEVADLLPEGRKDAEKKMVAELCSVWNAFFEEGDDDEILWCETYLDRLEDFVSGSGSS